MSAANTRPAKKEQLSNGNVNHELRNSCKIDCNSEASLSIPVNAIPASRPSQFLTPKEMAHTRAIDRNR